MKNWKTTLVGIALSAYPIFDAINQAYASGYFTGKTGLQLWFGIAVITLGVWARDKNPTTAPKNLQANDEDDETIVGTHPKDR